MKTKVSSIYKINWQNVITKKKFSKKNNSKLSYMNIPINSRSIHCDVSEHTLIKHTSWIGAHWRGIAKQGKYRNGSGIRYRTSTTSNCKRLSAVYLTIALYSMGCQYVFENRKGFSDCRRFCRFFRWVFMFPACK